MSAEPGYDPSNFYIWRASEGLSVHLSLKVVTQLAAQISRAASESQPREPRGILLGRILYTPSRTTVIEDFKLFAASEFAEAHPDSDDALFAIACRMSGAPNGQRALGFFRAQRDGSLTMGPRDLDTFSRLFGETGNIALLIQTAERASAPNESKAALYYWQFGGAHPCDFGFSFPLDAVQLAGGHPGWRFPNPFGRKQPVAAAPAKPAAAQSQMPAPAYFPRERIQWLRLLPTAALVIIGIVATQLAMSSHHTAEAVTGPTEAAPDSTRPAEDQSSSATPSSGTPSSGASGNTTPSNSTPSNSTPTNSIPSNSLLGSATPGGESPLGLTVMTRANQLEIRWNRRSAAIATSDKGVMRITENGVTEAVPFDQAQLLDGYVAYGPKTNDVSIRLEVTGKDGRTTSESIRSVAIP